MVVYKSKVVINCNRGEITLKNKKKIGRPSGKIKTAKIEITIEPEIKEKFMEKVHSNNKQASVVLRKWIMDYLESSDRK